jgi:CTP:phosphocholine cytidylyltransferase-like protein
MKKQVFTVVRTVNENVNMADMTEVQELLDEGYFIDLDIVAQGNLFLLLTNDSCKKEPGF